MFVIFLKVDGGADSVNDAANTIMHKFWDSAFALEPPEEYDNHRLFLFLHLLFLILNMWLAFSLFVLSKKDGDLFIFFFSFLPFFS